MQLTVWTYEGPPHVGAMRVATGMTGVHYVLHAPQGDTYADLLFTMIERRDARPPVTYTTFQARDLGKDTAELLQSAIRDAYERFQPEALLVGASCTAELIQDDPAGLAKALDLPIPVINLDLPSYQRKENWGAAETFYALVRTLADTSVERSPMAGRRPRANLLGPTALGFRHRDDIVEITKLLDKMGIDVNVTAPMGASPADLKRLGAADFNILLYPETGDTAARWLEKNFKQPTVRTVPIGYGATCDFVREIAAITGVDAAPMLRSNPSRLPWYSRSVDSTYLTAKRVFIFGDATHAIAAARVATEEMGFEVVGLGCYNREFARDIREAARKYGIEPLVTDDYLEVEAAIAELHPELVLGTQMERHIAKRLRIPCAVISAPVHVQDFPARYSPVMGFEGANVLFDTWVHPLVMGLEEHLLVMFRDDFEFNDAAGASHLGHTTAAPLPLLGGGRRPPSPPTTSPGPPTHRRNSPRSRFSSAARRGATPRSSPASMGWPPSTSRRCMMQSPISRADAPEVRVVIVTLDNHLSGAADRAETTLRRDNPGLSLHFHAAADWENNPASLARCRDDITRGDIIIASMLFLDDHIKAVLPALTARRDACDAIVGVMSDAAVVKLTRLGDYRMDKPAKGPLALLKKLRGSSKPGTSSSGSGQMAMLKRLPKILRFIPGTAQDVRAYFLTLQYWLAGSDENFTNLVRNLVDRYADGPRRALRGTLSVGAPAEYPELGVYHPRMASRLSERVADLPLPAGAVAGTVGLLVLRSYLLGGDTGHYDGVIAAFEARGLRVIPAFSAGLDARPAIDAFFVRDGAPVIDAMVSLSGFSLVGGPAYNDSAAAAAALAKLDVPYLAAHPLEFQTLQAWGAGNQGLLPLEATMMVAIPELDGATVPTVFGGRSDGSGAACTGCDRGCTFPKSEGTRVMQPCPERAAALAARTLKLVELRRVERANRKLALVIFNFPPNAGAVGTAAYLSVFDSVFNTLARLKAEGYSVDLPADVDALRNTILYGNASRFGSDANVYARIATDDHVRREPYLREIEAQWGPSPGRQQADAHGIHVLGERFGNVFVGIQPAFGYEGDPMRLLFDGTFAPTHAFSAFYRWIREDFGAHAALHFGTHGALEFMPGKQAGLSAKCWPDRLIGDLPNFYLYASNNPSEGTIAKRRSNATLISYMTPPIAQSGLYKGLLDLNATIERHRATQPDAANERAMLALLIQEQAAGLDLVPAEPTWTGEASADVLALAARVYELEQTLIPHGLHVVGRGCTAAERIDLLLAIADAKGRAVYRDQIEDLVAGHIPDDAVGNTFFADLAATDRLLAVDTELGAIVDALDGRYVAPAPGGDVLRTPAVLPTGRNIHGFDPFRIPSAFATRDGAKQAQRLLDRHLADGAAAPESIAIVLWGTDNLKTEGAQIAQVMALMGARPRFDGYGRLCGAELIPLAELGRARIDVVVTLSGIFRDLLPMQTRMIAEAAFLATTADEPEALNFIRKHSLAHQAKLGCDLDTASLRVFSNAEGAYGANVNLMLDSGVWTDGDELADAYENRKGFAYGRSGAPVKQAKMLSSNLAVVDLTYQNLDSVELGVTSVDQYVDSLGGISRSITRAKGVAAPVYIGDQTQGEGKVRTLGEQVALETRTRMLNPLWTEGMLKSGFEGVRQIEVHVTNTMGWSATTGDVAPWVYQRISETYVLDAEMRERLAGLNPKAAMRVAGRLLEAHDRNFWSPDAATLAALRAASDELEDRLEGIAAPAAMAA